MTLVASSLAAPLGPSLLEEDERHLKELAGTVAETAGLGGGSPRGPPGVTGAASKLPVSRRIFSISLSSTSNGIPGLECWRLFRGHLLGWKLLV